MDVDACRWSFGKFGKIQSEFEDSLEGKIQDPRGQQTGTHNQPTA